MSYEVATTLTLLGQALVATGDEAGGQASFAAASPDRSWFSVSSPSPSHRSPRSPKAEGAALGPAARRVGTVAAMAFEGWSSAAIEFYEGLEADNSKAYWTEHKSVYEDEVRAPMEALLENLAPEYGEAKVFRPYRDVRFSADKSPYKTAIAASLAGGGYVGLSAAGLGAGLGTYDMAKDQLERYREAVDDEGTGRELEAIVDALGSEGIEVTSRESLKIAPRGYPKDHPRIELLRHKSLYAFREWAPGDWLATAEAKKRVVGLLRRARPLGDWLATNVGDSELER